VAANTPHTAAMISKPKNCRKRSLNWFSTAYVSFAKMLRVLFAKEINREALRKT
jgi:hypothetical protein